VGCVAFRADGRRLASGAGDGSVLVWDVAGPYQPIAVTAFARRSPVTCVAWNPAAADLLAVGTADGTAAVWRVVDDRPPHVMTALAGHPGPIREVAWMPDGQHLCCLFGYDRAAVWHAMSETYLGELTDCVRLAVSQRGLVATVSDSGETTVRDLWRGSGPAVRQFPAPVTDCAWSPGGRLILSRADGALDLTTPYLEPLRTVGLGAPLLGVTWAFDGPVTGGEAGVVALDESLRPRWRSPAVLPGAGTLAAGGPAVAAATAGDRPHVLSVADGATLLAPAAAMTAGPSALPWQTFN
jgi:hypothetical protein